MSDGMDGVERLVRVELVVHVHVSVVCRLCAVMPEFIPFDNAILKLSDTPIILRLILS